MKYILLFALFGSLLSCSTSNMNILSSTYQPYIISEINQGTQLEIILKDVAENVTFNNIVFNRVESPVSTEKLSDGTTKITAVVERGKGMIEGEAPKKVNTPNQLSYTINGKDSFIQLNDLERLPTKLISKKL